LAKAVHKDEGILRVLHVCEKLDSEMINTQNRHNDTRYFACSCCQYYMCQIVELRLVCMLVLNSADM